MKIKQILLLVVILSSTLLSAEIMGPQQPDYDCVITPTESEAITSANRVLLLCELQEDRDGIESKRCMRDHLVRILELNYQVKALLHQLRLGVNDVFGFRAGLGDLNPKYIDSANQCAVR